MQGQAWYPQVLQLEDCFNIRKKIGRNDEQDVRGCAQLLMKQVRPQPALKLPIFVSGGLKCFSTKIILHA